MCVSPEQNYPFNHGRACVAFRKYRTVPEKQESGCPQCPHPCDKLPERRITEKHIPHFFLFFRILFFIPCLHSVASLQCGRFAKILSDPHTIDFGIHMLVIRFGWCTAFDKFFYITLSNALKFISDLL